MKTLRQYSMTVFISIIFMGTKCLAQTVPDEAKKHYDRGQAAIEMATTPYGYQDALTEFNNAVNIAPNWAEPYLSIALVNEKLENYSNAIESYKKYLTLSPESSNTDAVKTSINKLEYKLEKQNDKNKVMNVLVSCNKPGSKVHLLVTGSKFTIYFPREYSLKGDKLMANILYIGPGSKETGAFLEQTVPVDFDGKTMKFNFINYVCPEIANMNYCPTDVKIIAELVSTSPVTFNITEILTEKKYGNTTQYTGVWTFSEQ